MNTCLLCVVLLAVVLVFGAVCLWQQREIRRKKRLLAQFIKEAVEYKWKYHDASYNYMLAGSTQSMAATSPGNRLPRLRRRTSAAKNEQQKYFKSITLLTK